MIFKTLLLFTEVADPGFEDGEVVAAGAKDKFDTKKIIEYPGFNCPCGPDIIDVSIHILIDIIKDMPPFFLSPVIHDARHSGSSERPDETNSSLDRI